MRRPWFRFYVGDWRQCPELRRCSLAARGLWADLMALAHQGEPYGHVSLSIQEIALDVGRQLEEVSAALAELEHWRVFSRTPDGAIFSRRMVRDGEESAKRSEWGSLGGNPNLQDKAKDKPRDKAKDKLSRARDQSQSQSQKSESEPEDRSREEPPPTPRRGKRAARARLSAEQVREAIAAIPSLDTEAFRLAFSLWLKYRDEQRYKPYQPLGLQACLAQLAKIGPERAIAAIGHTMGKGWQGIREEEPGHGGGAQTKLERSFAAIDRVFDEAQRRLGQGRLEE